MLKIVEFEDGRYGVINTWTGILLSRRGKVASFRSMKRAIKFAQKRNNALAKTLRSL